MVFLVIGKGGREHALAWKLASSQRVEKVVVIPGNPLMKHPKIHCVKGNTLDFAFLLEIVQKENVDITLVGPEVELAHGIVDYFEERDLSIIGPNKYCAQIESSKEFCKQVLLAANIPTARHTFFIDYKDAIDYLTKRKEFPIVIKIDGLAAGKGVYIAYDLIGAIRFLQNVFEDSQLGFDRDDGIVIEEYLEGREFSLLAFVNDENIEFMPIVQDYKRAFTNDEGPNTGGMGMIFPVDKISEQSITEARSIINKLVQQLVKQKTPYKGILYGGFMQTKKGVQVIEFNVRFGDPETEVLMPMLESDFGEFLNDFFVKKEPRKLQWSKESFCGVVIAAKGYPNEYVKNIPIKLPLYNKESTFIFGMGVDENKQKLISSGGRILIVVSKDKNLALARAGAYEIVSRFDIKDLQYRLDIGEVKN